MTDRMSRHGIYLAIIFGLILALIGEVENGNSFAGGFIRGLISEETSQ